MAGRFGMRLEQGKRYHLNNITVNASAASGHDECECVVCTILYLVSCMPDACWMMIVKSGEGCIRA